MVIHFKHTLGRVWQAYHAYWSTYSPVQSLASFHSLNFSFFILNYWPSYFTEQTSNQNTVPSSFLSVCQYFECHLLSAYYDELGMLSCNVKPFTWTFESMYSHPFKHTCWHRSGRPPSSLFLSLSIPLCLTTYFPSFLSHFPHPGLTGNLWKAVCTVLGTSNSSPQRSLETILLGFSLNILQKLTLSGLPVTYLLSYAWVDLVSYFQSLDSQDSFPPWCFL